MIFARTLSAFSPVITCSSAHGASTSQSTSSRSSFEIGSAPRSPWSDPVSALRAIAAETSMPFGLESPPEESEIAMTFAPASARNFDK
jgi:hypothetical protein